MCRKENLLSIAGDSSEVFVTVQDIVLLLIRCMTTIDSKTWESYGSFVFY